MAKTINVPEEILEKAFRVLSFKDSINYIIKSLAQEISKNHMEAIELWNIVREEAARQGIVLGEDELFKYDPAIKMFIIVKK